MNLKERMDIDTTPDQRVVFTPRKVSNDESRRLEQSHTCRIEDEQNIFFYSLTHKTFQQFNVGLCGSAVHHLGCPAANAMVLNNKIEAIDVGLPG